jgi:hypothetical protein
MKISEHVRTTITHDGAVVMHIRTGAMVTLNLTGSIIWQGLSEGRSPEELAGELECQFQILHAQAVTDVNEFLEHLKAQELIESDESNCSRKLVNRKRISLFRNLFGRRESRSA